MGSDFIKEEIKKKPVNKNKLIKKLLINALCAVVFGIIASLVMLLIYPFLQKMINGNQTSEPVGIVTLPENTSDMSPEEMLSEYMMQESALMDELGSEDNALQVDMPLTEEQIQAILNKVYLNVSNYRQLATSMAALAKELSKYTVTVTSSSTSVDWMNSVNNNKNITSGISYAKNNVELFILVDSSRIKKNDELKVTFSNNVSLKGELKAIDSNTNLAVISVNLSDIPNGMNVDDYIANIGSSNGLYVGLPVMAVGSPKGVSGSMGYGILDAPKKNISQVDSYISVLQTDIAGSDLASGALFNLQGQVIGIITTKQDSSSGENVIVAYGVSEIKNRIEKMSNGIEINYIGVTSTDVTSEAISEMGVPQGTYVLSVQMDSPAMKAGMQSGDVIIAIDGITVFGCSDFISGLNQKSVGDTIIVRVMRKSQDMYTSMDFELVVDSFG